MTTDGEETEERRKPVAGDEAPAGRKQGEDDKSKEDKKDENPDDQSGRKDGGDDAEKDEKKPSPLKKPWVCVILILIVILLVVAGAVYGWYYWTSGRFFQSTNDAYVKADQVQVATQISGDIAQLFVKENQTVAAGEDLLQIGDGAYKAKVDQANAQVAQSLANEAEARAELNKQPAVIAEAVAQEQMGQANLRYAQSEVDRYKPLAESGAETKEKYAQLVSQRDQAAAQLASYAAQTEAQKLTTPSLAAKVAEAEAATRQAEAQLESARIDLGDTLIRSPISGRVGDLTARAGQYAQAGMQLLTVVPVQDIYLEANFKETQIGLMRVGQPVSVSVDALPQETVHGRIVSFSPGTGAEFSLIPPQNATGNFTKVVQRIPVRISLDAGPEARKVLLPGLSVTAEVDTRSAKGFIKDAKEEEKKYETLEEEEKVETRKDQSAL